MIVDRAVDAMFRRLAGEATRIATTRRQMTAVENGTCPPEAAGGVGLARASWIALLGPLFGLLERPWRHRRRIGRTCGLWRNDGRSFGGLRVQH